MTTDTIPAGIHHATLYVTTQPGRSIEALRMMHTQAECIVIEQPVLAIADARRLVEQAFQTPGEKTYRLFIVAISSLASDAAQTLLKILEEPPRTTQFAFVVPPEMTLLPTVRSRFHIIQVADEAEMPTAFALFLKASPTERLAQIADIAKRKDDDAYRELERGLQVYLIRGEVPVTDKKTLALYLQYLGERGGSKKMVFEALALFLPVAR